MPIRKSRKIKEIPSVQYVEYGSPIEIISANTFANFKNGVKSLDSKNITCWFYWIQKIIFWVKSSKNTIWRRYWKYKGYLKVKKEIQQHITFKKFNLISDRIPRSDFDAVLCRNVMIYFTNQTSEAVVNKLYQSLGTEGFFAIGNAESLMNYEAFF